ncbi:hypothetical protein GF389_00810 [Candidatus Dojkabacteria bacterium]|nr:hypothetical protein [Candidatus Dojkabacteria bacterium]
MNENLKIKLWTERKALSRGRWDNTSWERQYSLSLGNRGKWRDEKRILSKAQRKVIMQYQLGR